MYNAVNVCIRVTLGLYVIICNVLIQSALLKQKKCNHNSLIVSIVIWIKYDFNYNLKHGFILDKHFQNISYLYTDNSLYISNCLNTYHAEPYWIFDNFKISLHNLGFHV